MARKIANNYKIILGRRRRRQRIIEITLNSWAKRLQRFMYRRFFLFAHAAKKIQKMIRAFLARKWGRNMRLKEKVVVHIQKAARGYIVRTSERFLLVQLYLKLPAFWKELMNFKPSQDQTAVKHRFRKENTPLERIRETRRETQYLQLHIRRDVVKDRMLPLKLPFTVPQPFDKQPYVSLNSGKKMSFYSHKESILSSEFDSEGHKRVGNSSNSAPIHIFNIKFWPLTNAPHVPDLATELHDPNLNGFEVATNFRMAVYCDSCSSRMKMIKCKTCQLGFCFPCAFRLHGRRAIKSTHEMEVTEPRLVQDKQAATSLIFNIDFARGISYDLR